MKQLVLASLAFVLRISPFFRKECLYTFIQSRIEEPPEYLRPIVAARPDQLVKFTLRDHGDLAKLALIESEKFFHLLFDGPNHRDRASVWIGEFDLRRPGCHALTALLRSCIARASLNLICLPAEKKFKFNECLDIAIGKVASQLVVTACHAARIVVKSKHDRIENERLA